MDFLYSDGCRRKGGDQCAKGKKGVCGVWRLGMEDEWGYGVFDGETYTAVECRVCEFAWFENFSLLSLYCNAQVEKLDGNQAGN